MLDTDTRYRLEMKKS